MSNAVTSSAALTELKNDLTRLSKTLHVIYDLMNTDMRQVGEAWQDGKYQEFVDGYKPQIDKCEEISRRYSDWCNRVLTPTIENVIAVEKTDVSGGRSSVSSIGGNTSAESIGNTDGANVKTSSGVAKDIDSFLNKPERNVKKPLSEADLKCKEQFGTDYHGIPSSKNEAHIHWGGSTPGNNKMTSEIEVDLGVLKGKLGSEASDGGISPEKWAKCVKE